LRARRLTPAARIAFLIALAFTVAAVSPVVHAAERSPFRKAPYLIYNGNAEQMDVHWQLTVTVQCTLSWGLEGAPPTHTVVTSQHTWGHQHTHTIDALGPGALYAYEVRAAGELSGGTFRTPPTPAETELKFLAYGDTRSFPADYDAVSAAILDLLATDSGYQTLAVVTGDLVNNGGSETDWDEQFFDPLRANIREFHATVPTQSVRGNHEGDGIMFEKYIPYPYVDAFYWSYDYGPVHFVSIDQYVDYGPGSAQLAWLANDLASTDRPWTILSLHEPGWSSGVHENVELVQTAIHPLCIEYGVAIVFAGHNHYYARAVVNDVMHVTTGGGGAPLYPPEDGYPHVVAADAVHHFCSVHIDGDTLRFAATSSTGELIDSFVMTRPITAVHDHGDTPFPEPAAVVRLLGTSPNPFVEETAIAFSLAAPSRVAVSVYDLAGRRIATLVDAELAAGEHTALWTGIGGSGRAVPSGIYFYEVSACGVSTRGKLLLLR